MRVKHWVVQCCHCTKEFKFLLLILCERVSLLYFVSRPIFRISLSKMLWGTRIWPAIQRFWQVFERRVTISIKIRVRFAHVYKRTLRTQGKTILFVFKGFQKLWLVGHLIAKLGRISRFISCWALTSPPQQLKSIITFV